jgi:hypothetical protein
MASFGPTIFLDQTGYISVAAVTAAYGSALTAAHFWKGRNAGPAKSKQKAFAPPLGTSPRLGVPVIRQRFGGAAATRHPWRGAAKPASLPVYPPNHYRIPASVVNGAPEIKIKSQSQSRSKDC